MVRPCWEDFESQNETELEGTLKSPPENSRESTDSLKKSRKVIMGKRSRPDSRSTWRVRGLHRLVTGLVLMLGGLVLFQNCGQGFSPKTAAELQSLSCGGDIQCDAQGFPLGKIVIDTLPPADYPTGSYAPSRVESRVLTLPDSSMVSLVRLGKLPPGKACDQTWLRSSTSIVGGTETGDLLAALDTLPCRVGDDVSQGDAFLDFLFNSGCFFVETNYRIAHNVQTGVIDLTILGTAVADEEFTRTPVPTARIQFRCALPSTNAP